MQQGSVSTRFVMTTQSKTIILTIVRHGQTDANIKRIIDGQGIDSPLNNIGLQEAQAAGKALQNLTFNAAYSSDLKRAHKTCQIILDQNQANSVMAENIKQEILLREKHFGVFEGQTSYEWKAEKGTIGVDFTPKNGESEETLQNRGKEFFQSVLKEVALIDHPVKMVPNVLIVTHGGFIRQLFSFLFVALNCALPPNADFSSCANTCFSTFKVEVCTKTFAVKSMECQDLFNADHLLSPIS